MPGSGTSTRITGSTGAGGTTLSVFLILSQVAFASCSAEQPVRFGDLGHIPKIDRDGTGALNKRIRRHGEGRARGLVVKPKTLEIRKVYYMRRYCKGVDITNIEFIERCIYLWLDGKRTRQDVRRFLSQYTDLNYRQVCERMRLGEYDWLGACIHKIAEDVQSRLINERLDLPPIEFKDKYDDVCGKWRRIGIQKPIHQIFDYIAVEACRDMFMSKIGPYQMASIPGRGQERGAKQIQKWIQLDPAHTRHWVKGDVRKCYPSIPQDRIKARFARDIKNPKLLWLICELIDSFPEGLSIGSYFSQFACNYYLSQAYHYVAEQLFRERRKKTGEKVRTRLIYHQIWFMDDILLLGTSARDLEKGMKLLSEFVSQNLGLTIKPEWRVETTDYIGADGKHHGHDIDMMGYRVYCDHISIRRRTFKRHRRTILRAWAKLGRGQSLPLATCRRIMSCKGKFKNSNSAAVSKRLKIARLERIASRTISAYDKDRAEALKKERREYHEKHSTCTGEAGRIAVHDAPRWAGGCLDQKEYRPAALPF